METPERKEFVKKIKELEAERDKQIRAVERESKKKAAEHPKTKEERVEQLTGAVRGPHPGREGRLRQAW